MGVDIRNKRRRVTALWIDGDPFNFESATLIEQVVAVEGTVPEVGTWELDVMHSDDIASGSHICRATLEDGSTWEQEGKVEFTTSVGDATNRRKRTSIQRL